MSWWKNGMLLAAGGVAGLAIAAWLESEGTGESRREPSATESIDDLAGKIRSEAEWAMDECTTDEQREKVYEEVKASIGKLQAALERSGEKIVTDLKGQQKKYESDDEEETDGADQMLKYRSVLEKLLKDLDTSKLAKSGAEEMISRKAAEAGLGAE